MDLGITVSGSITEETHLSIENGKENVSMYKHR